MSGPERNEDKVNTFGILLVGLASAILVWASVVLLQGYYQSTAVALEDERNATGKEEQVRSLRATQQASLKEARYVNVGQTKMASIPIEVAKAKVLADAKAGKPTLVPAVAAHNKPTLPAVPGKPTAEAPADDAPAGDAPAGDAPAGDAPAGDAPAKDAPEGAKQ